MHSFVTRVCEGTTVAMKRDDESASRWLENGKLTYRFNWVIDAVKLFGGKITSTACFDPDGWKIVSSLADILCLCNFFFLNICVFCLIAPCYYVSMYHSSVCRNSFVCYTN